MVERGEDLPGYSQLKEVDQHAVQRLFARQKVVHNDKGEPTVESVKSFLTVMQSVLTATSNALDSALSGSPNDPNQATEQLVGELRMICDQTKAKKSTEHVGRRSASSASSSHQQTPSTGSSSRSDRRHSMSTLSSATTIPSIAEEAEGAVNTPAPAAAEQDPAFVSQDPSSADTTTLESVNDLASATISSSSASHSISTATSTATPAAANAQVVSAITKSVGAVLIPATPSTGSSSSPQAHRNPRREYMSMNPAQRSRGVAQLQAVSSKAELPNRADERKTRVFSRSEAMALLSGSSEAPRGTRRASTTATATVISASSSSAAPATTAAASAAVPSVDSMRSLLRQNTQAKRDNLSRSYPRFKGSTVSQQQLARSGKLEKASTGAGTRTEPGANTSAATSTSSGPVPVTTSSSSSSSSAGAGTVVTQSTATSSATAIANASDMVAEQATAQQEAAESTEEAATRTNTMAAVLGEQEGVATTE